MTIREFKSNMRNKGIKCKVDFVGYINGSRTYNITIPDQQNTRYPENRYYLKYSNVKDLEKFVNSY